jgi:hypothetical protein
MAFFTDPGGIDLMLRHRYKSREEVSAEIAAAEA